MGRRGRAATKTDKAFFDTIINRCKKMQTIGIQVKRFPYEEPYHVRLLFTVDNGVFGGRLEYYCNASDLIDIGNALRSFPARVPDEYSYEIGSTKPEDRFAYYFALRAYTTDRSGHCALQVDINNNGKRPDEGACRFSFKVEPSALGRLGALLLEFAELEHHALVWTISGEGDCLVEKD